ncbi:hypothetical protein M409DRAFT_55987 [Zasmidium cellare ATCC 36951]|uniref:C2H2-type domain-containing protein n=1 Tax=Zasmidium cellare ATCC 36951 TaxID=1080233 RepID=A0A6A6CGM1_ZASCE|nr:uncharacterized protein M409DRAFT_55987 [Zasmidium cellare ATCC 36951]KAF2165092.1 hypothetical protein M409DRAFT_55987 [Zasmidium cellare ATCC 36951]
MDDDGSFLSWNNTSFDDSMLEPNHFADGRLTLPPLEELGRPSSSQDYGTSETFEASASYEHTPSLTMSPYTAYTPDFGSFVGENERRLSQKTLVNPDPLQGHAEKSDLKRPCTPMDEDLTAKRSLLEHDDDKSSSSHPIKCRGCSMRFRRRCDLRKHEKTKHRAHEERPHACEHCSKRFIWPKDVKRHVARVHKDVFAGGRCRSGNKSSTNTSDTSGSKEGGSNTDASNTAFDVLLRDDTYNVSFHSKSDPRSDKANALFSCTNSDILNVCDMDFEALLRDDLYDDSFDSTTQQNFICKDNNITHHTFSTYTFPGEGSAPHRGARV